MEEYTASNESLAAEPLTLPHFDEEATLLSARPVVPLHEVKVEALSKRRLGFGLAIAAAVVAGALGASAIYKQRDRSQGSTSEIVKPSATEPADSSKVFVTPSGEASGAAIDSNAVTAVVSGVPAAPSGEAKSVRTSNDVQAKTPTRSKRSKAEKQERASDEAQYQEEQIQADELDQRREERRAERRLRRERRNRREASGDDVMRIREIFEGRPRP